MPMTPMLVSARAIFYRPGTAQCLQSAWEQLMTTAEATVYSSLAVGIMMLGMWLLSLRLRDVSVVDIGWGLGFVLIVWVLFGFSEKTPKCWLIAVLTSIWGLRLSGYLFLRNHGKPEDYRYAAMREKHGSRFPLVSFFTVFVLQGVVMLVVALPVITGMSIEADSPINALTILGCVLWLVGFSFEAGGDWQLRSFKANPANAGKVLSSGFWKYTRHPNYFGDFAVWWGMYFVSFGSGLAWWSAIGPAAMSFFLMKVSGVTLLEKNLNKKPGYAAYVARTNAFFPWFPRTQPSSTSDPDYNRVKTSLNVSLQHDSNSTSSSTSNA